MFKLKEGDKLYFIDKNDALRGIIPKIYEVPICAINSTVNFNIRGERGVYYRDLLFTEEDGEKTKVTIKLTGEQEILINTGNISYFAGKDAALKFRNKKLQEILKDKLQEVNRLQDEIDEILKELD